MKRVLLAATMLAAMTVAGNAVPVVIADLGINPTSANGHFSHDVFGTTFEDLYTFQLVGGPQFITIASATNVFPGGTASSDFITGFQGSVYQQLGGAPNPATDTLLFGPQLATLSCPPPGGCQGLSGQATLNPGNYYLDLAGTGGGTSGYGGDLATVAVPGPIVGAGIPGLVMAALGWLGWRRRRVA